MNAVDSAEGAVVMGEVVNEDTIPAFVNVNATLVDASRQRDRRRKQLRQDSSRAAAQAGFSVSHRLSARQPEQGKNVRMDVKATLVPASSDPVIGVMNQKLDTDAQGIRYCMASC